MTSCPTPTNPYATICPRTGGEVEPETCTACREDAADWAYHEAVERIDAHV